MRKITKEEALFNEFSAKLIEFGVVSQRECDIIARRGTRKEYLWIRHLIDLATYASEQDLQREGSCKEVQQLCLRMLEWCKGRR